MTIDDYLLTLWKRKWHVLIPTLLLAVLLGGICLFLPKKWQVDAIIQPSKFLIKTDQGQFAEYILVPPKQIVSQINEEAYTSALASALKINPVTFPKLRAEIIPETSLVKAYVRVRDRQKGKEILQKLFDLIKRDFDRNVDAEIRSTDMLIAKNEGEIKRKRADIDSLSVEKNKLRQEIASAQNKVQISDERRDSIIGEMKEVKSRIEAIEKQQLSSLTEKSDSAGALGSLLYSNVIQLNLRYYNDLDENLSQLKIARENFLFTVKDKGEEIKKLDTQIEKIGKEIEIIEKDNELLNERKTRMDYVQLLKEPTSSLGPVSPRTFLIVVLGLVFGGFFFGTLAFFMEYLKSRPARPARSA